MRFPRSPAILALIVACSSQSESDPSSASSSSRVPPVSPYTPEPPPPIDETPTKPTITTWNHTPGTPAWLGPADACPTPPAAATLALPAKDSWSGLITLKDTSDNGGILFLTPIHINLTPDGELMMFGFSHTKGDFSPESLSLSPTFLMKPDLYSDAPANQRAQIYGVPYDGPTDSLVCAGHTWTEDGRLVVTGGTRIAKSAKSPGGAFREFGLTYGVVLGAAGWRRIPRDFIGGESWYPTMTRLSDGRLIMYSGYHELDAPISGALIVFNRTMQIFDPREPSEPWSVVSPHASTPQPTEPSNYTWIYELPNPIDVGGARQLFVMGSGGATYLMNHADRFTDPAARFVQRTPRPTAVAGEPAANAATVMLAPYFHESEKNWWRPGSVIAIGGGTEASGTLEKVDFYDPQIDKWCTWAAPLGMKRRNSTGIHLPDGNIAFVNGESFADLTLPQLTPHIYDPRTGAWMLGKPEDLPATRGYHSVASLLPDGRIFVAGGRPYQVIDAPNERTHGRYYSPYYLGVLPPSDRPQITAIPKDPVMHYGADYAVDYKNGAITGASLIALSSMTHATDFNARFVELELAGGANSRGKVTLRGPNNARIAPPGYFMLFLLRNVNGVNVPSVAQIIRIGGDNPTCEGVPVNACGGCRPLEHFPNAGCSDRCGVGVFKCDGPNTTSCNACL